MPPGTTPTEISLIEGFFSHYGLIMGFIAYVIIKDVIPFVKEKWLPAQMKAAEDDRIARNQDLIDERRFHRQNEIERNAEIKLLRETVQKISESLIQINADNSAIRDAEDQILDNQSQIMTKQETYHRETVTEVRAHDARTETGMNEMRQEVKYRKGYAEGHAKPKTGPLTDDQNKDKPHDSPAD